MSRYTTLVQASAVYDLMVTAAFAFPVLAGIVISQLALLHNQLALSGSFPVFAPLHLLFVNLLGSLVVVWSLVRLIRPDRLAGIADGVARMLFSGAMLWALYYHDITQLVLLFLVPELLWGMAQLAIPLWQKKRCQAVNSGVV